MAADISKKLDDMLKKLELIQADEVPDIDLYMDQVITFMESHLGKLKRMPEDKVLTKTMINNYAKNGFLPSPEKKKYSKNHVLLLTLIYYFKKVLSISDIASLLDNVTEKHFPQDSDLGFAKIYEEVVKFQPDIVEIVKKDLEMETNLANTTFEGEKDAEELKLFALLCLLSFDVYLKKTLIEMVIDGLDTGKAGAEKDKKEKKPKEKQKEKAEKTKEK
jgi:hypothetical protein